ncbi:MAG: HAD hydrolase-like protein [Vicinamibacterales bacterium]
MTPSKRPTRALFWDIDGTLLLTGRAGMIAWERAYVAVTGGTAFPPFRTDGMTDYQIAAQSLGVLDGLDQVPASDVQEQAAALVGRYERELPSVLPLRQGRVMANVDVVLMRVAERADLLSWLVTGNTAAGAGAKLTYYGLRHFFQPPGEDDVLAGAFANRIEPRARIVQRALERAQALVPGLRPNEALVIGDTPHDIEGAHAIGIPVLALSSATHSAEELATHEPWRLLPELPAPDAFEGLLRES